MKITILGAAGARTPLILEAMSARQARIGLDELVLMDSDAERLELIAALTSPLERSGDLHFKLTRTTDARAALDGAHVVITTFRVGGIASRVIDERVPLAHGVLGQETTGPGGFAMAMRTIPVLLGYVDLMRERCPDAWLVNFANPAGMLAEAVVRVARWERVVGICDAPAAMLRAAAALSGARPQEVFLDYFGLNHLGWVRAVYHQGRDVLPQFIAAMGQMGHIPGLPFDPELVASLGLIPNEYLYYYYYAVQSVQNILAAGQSRGEQLAGMNAQLMEELRRLHAEGDVEGMLAAYHAYLDQRGGTYMAAETGSRSHDLQQVDPQLAQALLGEGYAGVALDLVEGLIGAQPRQMILNVPNRGAIPCMDADDVVEIPAYVARDLVRPLVVGSIPNACLGLIKQVKAYERLTIEAAVEGSYAKAVQALTLHPLVRDYPTARAIVDGYREQHGAHFPALR